MPRRNLSGSGINSEGLGTGSTWIWIQEERKRDEQAGGSWPDHLEGDALIATADFVQESDPGAVDAADEPLILRARKTAIATGSTSVFGGDTPQSRMGWKLSESMMDRLWEGWRGADGSVKRGKFKAPLWVKPVVWKINDPDDIQLLLSSDGDVWIACDLSRLERATLWTLLQVKTRDMFAAQGQPWQDGLDTQALAASVPSRAPRALAAADNPGEPDELLAWSQESESVWIFNVDIKPSRAVFLAICPNYAGSRSRTISAPGGWWIKVLAWGKANASELRFVGSLSSDLPADQWRDWTPSAAKIGKIWQGAWKLRAQYEDVGLAWNDGLRTDRGAVGEFRLRSI